MKIPDWTIEDVTITHEYIDHIHSFYVNKKEITYVFVGLPTSSRRDWAGVFGDMILFLSPDEFRWWQEYMIEHYAYLKLWSLFPDTYDMLLECELTKDDIRQLFEWPVLSSDERLKLQQINSLLLGSKASYLPRSNDDCHVQDKLDHVSKMDTSLDIYTTIYD